MAYIFSTGNNPLTAPIAMWTLIDKLTNVTTGAGWLVKSDSDGTTYNATGGQVTSGSAGGHGLGNNNAWVRIQAPTVGGNTREIIFQRSTGVTQATFDLQWRVKYSANAGFTGGSPSNIQTPSAADEVIMCGGGTDAAPIFTAWFDTNAGYRWHIACGGATENYSFVAWAMLNTTTTMRNGIFLDVLISGTYPAADVDPAVICCAPFGGWTGYFGSINTNTATINPAGSRTWLGATSAAGASLTTNNVNVGLVGHGACGGQFGFAVNPFSSADSLYSPIYASGTGSRSPIGFKGFSGLFYFGSMLRTNMDTATTVGSKDRVFISQVWAPWDGSTPTL